MGFVEVRLILCGRYRSSLNGRKAFADEWNEGSSSVLGVKTVQVVRGVGTIAQNDRFERREQAENLGEDDDKMILDLFLYTS